MSARLLAAQCTHAAPDEQGGDRRLQGSGPRTVALGQTELSLLGAWSLRTDGCPVQATTSEQRLVSLLAIRGRQRRPYLAGMLWPEVSEKQALTRLRNILSGLRRRCPALLVTTEDVVALRESILVDVHQLEASARDLLNGQVDEAGVDLQFRFLVEASELLLGWYDDWILRERDRLNELRIRALEVLVEVLLELGRLGEASVAAIAAIDLDPLRESSHRALMRVYLAEANPALAARQVDRYRGILHAELGVMKEPTARMLGLLERGVELAEPPLVARTAADRHPPAGP